MKNGFSLVELSIVLVILGLLTGGILAGQSLIRAAELRSVSTEYQRYVTATQAFRDKYFAIPGDMPNAVRFWGAQAGGTADGYDTTCRALTSAATGTATCNGNGDGNVGDGGFTFVEPYRFWQHLANAQLIEGQYSGIAGSGSAIETVPGTNTPKLRLGNNVGVYPNGRGSDQWGETTILSLAFGGFAAANFNYAGFLKPEELWNIDKKLDDGRPGFGIIKGRPASWEACASSSSAATAEYNLTSAVASCTMVGKVL